MRSMCRGLGSVDDAASGKGPIAHAPVRLQARGQQLCVLPAQEPSGWSPRWRVAGAAAAAAVVLPLLLLGWPSLVGGGSRGLSVGGIGRQVDVTTMQQQAGHLDAAGQQPATTSSAGVQQPDAPGSEQEQQQEQGQGQQQEQQQEPQPVEPAEEQQKEQQQEQQQAPHETAASAAAPSSCSELCSLGKVKPYVGEVATNEGLAALLAATSFDKEVRAWQQGCVAFAQFRRAPGCAAATCHAPPPHTHTRTAAHPRR